MKNTIKIENIIKIRCGNAEKYAIHYNGDEELFIRRDGNANPIQDTEVLFESMMNIVESLSRNGFELTIDNNIADIDEIVEYMRTNGTTFDYMRANTFRQLIKISESVQKQDEEQKWNSPLNNGGNTSYYDISENCKNVQDLIEYNEMNFAQGNILKTAFTLKEGRHNGTSYERELNKLIWFAERELKRISEIPF